jgi:hypothetical protein
LLPDFLNPMGAAKASPQFFRHAGLDKFVRFGQHPRVSQTADDPGVQQHPFITFNIKITKVRAQAGCRNCYLAICSYETTRFQKKY